EPRHGAVPGVRLTRAHGEPTDCAARPVALAHGGVSDELLVVDGRAHGTLPVATAVIRDAGFGAETSATKDHRLAPAQEIRQVVHPVRVNPPVGAGSSRLPDLHAPCYGVGAPKQHRRTPK